jgi:hypothetical protein
VLYLIACAVPPTREVHRLVSLAQEQGWDVCVLTTPSGRRFADVEALERLTGHSVRSEYKNPDEPDVLPEADAVIVAPATVNTINKWAAGICDTLALGILVEAIGKGLPLVALPFSNYAHAAHPAFIENVGKLRSRGVTVLFGPNVYPYMTPGREAAICTCSRGREPLTPSSRAGMPGHPGDSSKLPAPRRDTGVQPARLFSWAGQRHWADALSKPNRPGAVNSIRTASWPSAIRTVRMRALA